MEKMRVLIACESSGVVREAFRALGHAAWSCDLLPADDGSPYHLQEDCVKAVRGGSFFAVWDLIIMHPPCTAICVSGTRDQAIQEEGRQRIHQLLGRLRRRVQDEAWKQAQRHL